MSLRNDALYGLEQVVDIAPKWNGDIYMHATTQSRLCVQIKKCTTLVIVKAKHLALSDHLEQHKLGTNQIRLLLSILVLTSHSYIVGGYGKEPLIFSRHSTLTLGSFAVAGFFALSGTLIALSAQRSNLLDFIVARFLRIFPAYFIVLAITAFLLGPIIFTVDHHSLAGYLGDLHSGPFSYLLKNALFPNYLQSGIHDIFQTTTPYGILDGASVLNGALWSLPLEVRCYVVCFVVVWASKKFRTPWLAFVALAAVGAGITANSLWWSFLSTKTEWALSLVFVFMCGTAVASIAQRVSVTPALIAGAFGLYVAAALIGGTFFNTVGLGTFVILIPAASSLLSHRFAHFFNNDLSYGAYLWAWPVLQVLAYANVISLPHIAYFALGLVITLTLAGFSWFFVERPAIRKKKFLSAKIRERVVRKTN